MINGVKTRQLKTNCDERGMVMELFRSDWGEFAKFGQSYITTAYPGAIKAWHFHEKQTDTFCCIKGMVKVVLFDNRENSPTRGEINEYFIGEKNYLLIQIPPDVYHGFKCISEYEAIVINHPTETFNYEKPDEYRLPAHTDKIPYSWERKDR